MSEKYEEKVDTTGGSGGQGHPALSQTRAAIEPGDLRADLLKVQVDSTERITRTLAPIKRGKSQASRDSTRQARLPRRVQPFRQPERRVRTPDQAVRYS
jgi:hypothetical protein